MPKVLRRSTRNKKVETCSICRDKIKEESKLHDKHDNSCGHTFCFDCIRRWISTGKRSCPLCRKQFESVKTDAKSITILNRRFSSRYIFTFINEVINNEDLKLRFLKGLEENNDYETKLYEECMRETISIGFTTTKIKCLMAEMEKIVTEHSELENEYYIERNKKPSMEFFFNAFD